jgi:hypothetical protein
MSAASTARFIPDSTATTQVSGDYSQATIRLETSIRTIMRSKSGMRDNTPIYASSLTMVAIRPWHRESGTFVRLTERYLSVRYRMAGLIE